MDKPSPTTPGPDPQQNENWMDSPLIQLQRQWMATNSKYQLAALAFAVLTAAITIALWAGIPKLLDPALTLPLGVVSIIWNATDLILVRMREDKIKLKWHIAAYCILWFGGFTSAGYQSYTIIKDPNSVVQGTSSSWRAVLNFLCATTAIMSLLHFILFIRACLETDRRKKDLRVRDLMIALSDRQEQQRMQSSWSAFTPSPVTPHPGLPDLPEFDDKAALAELGVAEPQEIYTEPKPRMQPVELP
ncbi:hypothetical protein PFICI_00798 [Pestalotiopsis fici W106-1]|uniref:MARVEL domain-containing protein n=1 Tax=Pestalotiopsis fici (strain W106-1 / CGMCC3.15140) TaxID=1229662 RepID=W3XLW3_PESFW|nr:uncharacterized protein PFICI_00798 [Pestalotiopsis fici W106-1]ETS86970.1 hypothetical protein PFICI_00798 [Pestalotiopsis fici W106-1]